MRNFEKILEKKAVRPTPMRQLVYSFLADKITAVSLTDIENTFDKVERTTLYRTLKTFEEKGIVHQIDDGTGIAKYALCEEGCQCDLETDLHLHFHCTKCGKTQCLTEKKIPHINLPPGFKAKDANLVVKGFCSTCS